MWTVAILESCQNNIKGGYTRTVFKVLHGRHKQPKLLSKHEVAKVFLLLQQLIS